jgi:hypothetical protein
VRLGAKAAAAVEVEEREAAEKVKHTVPPELLGIGIRIEDDVVITDEGHENMTGHVPKEIVDIEALCAEVSRLPTR